MGFYTKFAVICFSCNRKLIHWMSIRYQPERKQVVTRTNPAPALKGSQWEAEKGLDRPVSAMRMTQGDRVWGADQQ